MKKLGTLTLTALITTGFVSVGLSQVIVNDTWLDGTRDDPAAPAYSEMGVDSDLDGDIESAWFAGGAGTLDPVGPGGPLRLTQGSGSSSSITTYFTPEGSELTLGSAGNQIKLTWSFQLYGDFTDPTHSSHGFRLCLVDSPSASRVTGETSPGADMYSGYGMFWGTSASVFTRSDPFELYERANPGSSENLLSSSSAWSALGEDGDSGSESWLTDTPYTFEMTLTRTVGDQLAVATKITGGNINGTGEMQVSYTGAPNGGSWSFDTFEFRPDGNDRAYDVWDTSNFQVEFIPEPTTFALLGLGGLALMLRRRS